MKKILSLVLSLMLVACVFAGCGNTQTSENAVTVTVNFVADGADYYSKEVTVYADEPTVLMAVQNLMDENDDIVINLDSIDNPTTVLDVDDYTDGDKFWDFKIGDDAYGTNGRASNAKIKDGDVITWGYMTSDEFEALESAAE